MRLGIDVRGGNGHGLGEFGTDQGVEAGTIAAPGVPGRRKDAFGHLGNSVRDR